MLLNYTNDFDMKRADIGFSTTKNHDKQVSSPIIENYKL